MDIKVEFSYIVVFIVVVLKLFFVELEVNFLIFGVVFFIVVFFGMVIILVDWLVLIGGLEGFLSKMVEYR